MDRNKNILTYAEALKKENDELKKYITTLEEQLELLNTSKESWVHLKQ